MSLRQVGQLQVAATTRPPFDPPAECPGPQTRKPPKAPTREARTTALFVIGSRLRLRNVGADAGRPAQDCRARRRTTTAGSNRGARNAFQFYAIALGLALVVRLLAPALGHASLVITMATPAVAAAIMLVFVAPEGGSAPASPASA